MVQPRGGKSGHHGSFKFLIRSMVMRRLREVRLEAKLYRDIDHQDRWIAWSAKIGWVGFHARPNGWAEREPVVELEALRLREVPLAQAFNTSLLEAFQPAVRPAARALSG
jgi:hypothetical protein